MIRNLGLREVYFIKSMANILYITMKLGYHFSYSRLFNYGNNKKLYKTAIIRESTISNYKKILALIRS